MRFYIRPPLGPKPFALQDLSMRGTSRSRLLIPSTALLIALAGIAVSAITAEAQNIIPDRITAAVSNSSRAVIPGSVSPRVSHAADLGPSPQQTLLQGMSLRFTPSPAQQAALDQLLADQQNPASPRFRQWLTPQQYAAQFGLSNNDIAKIAAWLSSQGFTITGVANGGSFITFDGTVAQAQTAFATSIHSLSVNGESHFANITEPSVPSSIAGVVGALTGLHDFRARPHLRTSIVKPNVTSSLSGNHFLAPGDINTIYDVKPLLANSITGAGIGTGTNCHSVPAGTTCGDIAVMGAVDITPSDIASFRTASGLSTANLPTTVHEGTDPGPALNCNPATTNCPSGVPNEADLDESSIDLEWSGAMAPAASILFVNGKDIFNNSLTQAIDQKLAPVLTISYGQCEAGWGSSFLNSFNQLFKQASAQGQTILAAAGDGGATDCDGGSESEATEGLAVDFPASSPYVTALGGTMFSGDAEATCTSGPCNGTTASVYSSTLYWSGTPGSTDAVSSALSYIPEAPWSDLSSGSFGGGGGGASAFFPKPAWQVETGASGMTTSVQPDGARDIPDISLGASDLHDNFLFCASGWCVNGFRNSSNYFDTAGGTSFDSQIFGGMLALVVQKTGSWLGNINPTLYALGNKVAYYNPTSSSVFHDVTSGSNAMPCASGSVECPSNLSLGYSAGTGYDLATGWGSVDLNNLANDWNLVPPLSSGSLAANQSATSLTASSSSVAAATSGSAGSSTFTAAVTGAVGTPTGTVQFLINNVALGSAVTLNSSGVAAYTWSPTCSTLGPQSITAVYSGDSNYQGSIGPSLTSNGALSNSYGAIVSSALIVNVTTGTCPSFSLSGPGGTSNSTITVAAGGTIPPVTITVAPVNGLTGTVIFTATVTDSTGYVPGITFTPTVISMPTVSSTVMTLSGITASLRLPNLPGTAGSGPMLARQNQVRAVPWSAAASGVTIACLLLLVLPRRRRLGGLLLLALSVALALGASGCGSSQSAPPTTTTTSPYAGTYTVTGTYSGSAGNIPPVSTTVTYIIN
jgi:subtilase family serine protease